MTENPIDPTGRRRLRSPLRPDGHKVWSMDLEKYEAPRDLILKETQCIDTGEGLIERMPKSSPQRIRLTK